IHLPTLLLGAAALGLLIWSRGPFKVWLSRFNLPASVSDMLVKAGPVAAVVLTTLLVSVFGLDQRGVPVVGAIPQGLPQVTLPTFDPELWQSLLPAALLISLIGFVESISVAQTLAAKRRQRIAPNRELLGLGSANMAAAFSGGFPVTGGFSRSVVSFEAGARSPLAGVITAVGIALTAALLTPLFHFLPKATLAATIIVAVLTLVDLPALKRTWDYSRTDFTAMAATVLVVLLVGVEAGVMTGVVASILLFLWKTSRPHVAVVGQVPDTEHFRNVLRHEVITHPTVLSIRVDESLYFANARFLEDLIYDKVVQQPLVEHVVLMCPAINHIDASALESLEDLMHRLSDAGVKLHLSEVKGPVMDKLKRSPLLEHLSGQVFLSQYQALQTLQPELDAEPPAPLSKAG
ncbi:MAG: SulP family inorganic anion transporter, partial [Motiliproteus sp.]|nr:SulP family inorganic anion transporter [Motiliproteus sp.]